MRKIKHTHTHILSSRLQPRCMLFCAQFFRSHDFDVQCGLKWGSNRMHTMLSLKSFQLISGCLIHSADWVNKIIKCRAPIEWRRRRRRSEKKINWSDIRWAREKIAWSQLDSTHCLCVCVFNIVLMSLLGRSTKCCVIGSIGSFATNCLST